MLALLVLSWGIADLGGETPEAFSTERQHSILPGAPRANRSSTPRTHKHRREFWVVVACACSCQLLRSVDHWHRRLCCRIDGKRRLNLNFHWGRAYKTASATKTESGVIGIRLAARVALNHHYHPSSTVCIHFLTFTLGIRLVIAWKDRILLNPRTGDLDMLAWIGQYRSLRPAAQIVQNQIEGMIPVLGAE